MKKLITLFLILSIVCIPLTAETDEDFEDFEYFDTYLHQYKNVSNWGAFGTFFGLSNVLIGIILSSTAIYMESNSLSTQDLTHQLKISGYSILGIGSLSALIGLPFWMYGTAQYQEILNKRQLYYLITR